MLNEFVYCPRLFYYEWVEGVFAHNTETVEGALRHAGLDAKSNALVPPEKLTDDERVHSRSVTLSSEVHQLIATMDLVEAEGATPRRLTTSAARLEKTAKPASCLRGTPTVCSSPSRPWS
jgi:hypothetical protein